VALHQSLTSEGSSDEDRRKATDASNKRCTRDSPIFASDVMMRCVTTAVDRDTDDDEDLYIHVSTKFHPWALMPNLQ